MRIMVKCKQKINENKFLRGLSVLMAGTALSHVFIAVTTPIITRLYTPEEFGNLSVFLALLYTVSVIASLLYETAIPLPEQDSDAFHLFALSVIIVIFMSIIVLIGVIFLPIATLLRVPVLEEHLWLLSISLLGIGIFQAFNAWALRKEQFHSIARAKITMNSSSITAQIMLGFFQLGLLGLVIGEVIGRIGGAFGYFGLMKQKGMSFKHINGRELKKVAKRYKSFPLLSSWSAVLNSLGIQLPTFFLAAHFEPKMAGWYLLAQKILTVPEGLIGYSASQVYLSQSAQIARISQEQFQAFFLDIAKKMFLIAFFVIGFIDLIAPLAIDVIFGKQWGEAAVYLRILSLLFVMKIIVNPLSANFYVLEAMKYQMLSESIRFILICISVIIALYYLKSPVSSLICISLMSSAGYATHGLFSWYVIKKNFKNLEPVKSKGCEE